MRLLLSLLGSGLLLSAAFAAEPLFLDDLDATPLPVADDPELEIDYDIVYIRAPRGGDQEVMKWPEIAHPAVVDPGADLMLLHPDGSEEVLVAGGADGAVTDPFVSLDGEWIFYAHIQGLKNAGQHGAPPKGGADIFKIHLATRKIERLTHQEFTPNTGATDWASDFRAKERGKTRIEYGVLNLGPCPLPNKRLVFVSSRNGFIPPEHPQPTLQLFVMDDDGANVEMIGHLNIAMALHPTVMRDGRILFSTMESQALRRNIHWGLWVIDPDGTDWGPVMSAFDHVGAPNAFHFQTQLSDGSVIAAEYYNQNNSGFGAYLKLREPDPMRYPAFGPGYRFHEDNAKLRFGRHYNGKGRYDRIPFTPLGAESFTRFADNGEGLANPSILNDKNSPRVGKVTHPSAAPDNHCLTVWSPGPVNHQNGLKGPAPDGGLYLIKDGKPVDEPGQMRLIKNDPDYNEQWPRAVVPYQRIYGISEPATVAPLANVGGEDDALPPATPFGLIGAASLYKRETYPMGVVPDGKVTGEHHGQRQGDRSDGYDGLDPFNTSQNGASLNWTHQGADAGRYDNEDIWGLRILAMEPTTHRHRGNYPKDGRRFRSHASERLRILGEFPVCKGPDVPPDPDGNPDTSFLAKIPADTAFTFQTLDHNGMVLNMSQTWHQLRPGEKRVDCGGCHAHSQKPTAFEDTYAAYKAYHLWDLTERTPLLERPLGKENKPVLDQKPAAPRQAERPVVNVEYFRDIQPILERSCVACHSKDDEKPAGQLVLDADDEWIHIPNRGNVPGTYYRLAQDAKAQFGHKPVIHNGSWRQTNASRYVRKFQSRRSLLVWKIFGGRQHPAQPRPFRPRLQRQGHAATEGGAFGQGSGPERRGPTDHRPLDRPRLSDRSRR